MTIETDAPARAMPTRAVFPAAGWGLLGALTALNFFDDFGIAAFAVLAPDIQHSLGLSDASVAILGALGGVLVLVAAAPAAVAADRYRRLTVISITSIFLGVFAMLTGLAQSAWQLVVARVGTGLGKGNLPAFNSVITDAVPIEGRSRAFSLFNSTNALALMVTPVFVGLVAAIAGGPEGWRWAFLACGLPPVFLGLVAAAQREPERGRYEREAALGVDAVVAPASAAEERAVPITEAFARLKRIRTFHGMTMGFAALGAAIFAVPTFMNLLLENQYGLDTGARGIFGSVSASGLLAGTLLAGVFGDRLYGRDPRLLLKVASWCILGYLLAVPAIHMPNVVALTVLVTLANVGMMAAFTLVGVAFANIIPPALRSMGFAMVTLYLAVVGGLGGAGAGGALSGQYGQRTALTVVLLVSVPIGALYMRRASAYILDDLEAVARDLREEDARRRRRSARGAEPIAGEPLLEVAHLDVAYGPLQVLFDVDIEVRRGEVLALLGTNGAGKSTLLRAVTGLTFPSAGTVVMDGEDITYMEPADRVAHGIVMVPGGKAVFGPLSVEDNLRLGGFLLLDDESHYRARQAEVLDLFPVLRERLHQPAGTLSGGERQMLALAKAMLLEPTLLCIDELSLGLAPIVVAEMIEVVARLREAGMTMVIVEQSVNVALTLADRAVFMEKGHLRFEGPAAELLERDDLVRAVFLGGDRG